MLSVLFKKFLFIFFRLLFRRQVRFRLLFMSRMRVLTRGWSHCHNQEPVRDIQWLSGDHCSPGHTPALAPGLIYDRANDHRGISHPHLITSDPAKITQPQIARPESMDDSIINNRQIKSDQFPTLSDVLVTAISWASGDRSSIFYQFHHRPDTRHQLTHSQLYWRDTEDGSVDIIALRAVHPVLNVSVGRLLFSKHPVSEGRETSRGEPWISWPTSEERGCCRSSPPARYIFHPWSRHNFSPFSHSGASLYPETRHENLIRWESLNKQTALSRQWQGAGHWSASHDTESDDKMGRDNGKLTRAGITPDLARSITAGLNFRQALNQFREWNWKSLHQN